jgi:hypothetical protein
MTLLTFLTALALSGVAAYYSVIGLAAIFPGSFWPIIIMGSVLEGAKLVTVSWLYRNWKQAHIGMRVYLTAASVILMLITSMGIFGYLSKAHLEHSADTAPLAAKVQLLDEKIRVAKGNLDDNRKIIKQMDEMVDQTMGRSSDEKGIANSVVIRRSQQKERSRIQVENEAYQKTISQLTEEKFPLQNELQKVESDFGPIKYVAELVYGSGEADIIDKAVRLVIMLIMVVFDPLAVLLLIAANMSMTEKKPVRSKTWDDFMKGQPTELVTEPEVNITQDEMYDLMVDAAKDTDKHAYLKQPFKHFENLKPMPYIPEKVEEVVLTEEETKHNTIEIEKENVIVLDEITGETMPAITSKRLEPKYDYDEPYSFREKENK